MLTNQQKNLISSGINSHFYGEGLNFESYVRLMQSTIIRSRTDLNEENLGKIVIANSPFSWSPHQHKQIEDGVLLIHGLFDSPFYVRDLGEYFLSKDFLVNAILLPGHGTVPGDLLTVHYEDWLKSLNFGIKSLAKQVENIYLVGYSLGGLLALYGALENNDKIKGIILIAPALKARNPLKFFLAKYHRAFSWLGKRAKWFRIKDADNFAKYNSFAFNAGHQARKLLHVVNAKLKQTKLNIPMFVVISKDDETISYSGILSFFQATKNPDSRLLIYTNDQIDGLDPRILVRPSLFPHLNIINFSHSCLTISPENTFLGAQSQYVDMNHYPDGHQLHLEKFTLGAITKENLKRCVISRLSYNPDFNFMLKSLEDFLAHIEKK